MKKIIVVAGLIAFSQAALAHTGLLPTGGFSHGFQHPFWGLDHFLVMLGLGLWASSQRRKLAWQAIGVFLSFMIVGVLFGLAGFGFAYVETAILISLLLVGAALSFSTTAKPAKLPKAIILPSIALFAMMHGLAHGSALPVTASAYAYIAGIVSATAVLHVSGLALGLIARCINAAGLIHIYGAITGLVGAWLLLA